MTLTRITDTKYANDDQRYTVHHTDRGWVIIGHSHFSDNEGYGWDDERTIDTVDTLAEAEETVTYLVGRDEDGPDCETLYR
jgi:hypothetical protein